MSDIAKQLREAIKKWNSGSLKEGESAKIICLLFNNLPQLLDEYEKMEREAEAGKVLVKWLEEKDNIFGEQGDNINIGPNITWRKKRDTALSAYRITCGEEK